MLRLAKPGSAIARPLAVRVAILLFAVIVAVTGLSCLSHATAIHHGSAAPCLADTAGDRVIAGHAAEPQAHAAADRAGHVAPALLASEIHTSAVDSTEGTPVACMIGVLCVLAWALLLVAFYRQGRMRGAKLAGLALVRALTPTHRLAARPAPSLALLGLLRI